ncbi:unnamed protein product [Rotaria sordida]|uniref:Uncharacterized protein n=1 Tax=Rotaria sordida TaxID=392033 RepID=A0A815FP92_9BILA|nr:unnamed protein product [Rotaria sordida]CAF1410419.1 unnamed protein product [Rotaria sordida]CAF3638623.1 unnamed protein product [Rotaria sordida]CAF3888690.1 unnamed protein product [Rotaria sordida]
MVSRNNNSISFALGLTGGILGFMSLVFTCIGVALPTWYIGTSADQTVIITKANLFSSCYAPYTSQGIISSTLNCGSYNSYSCSTTSYQNSVLNITSYSPGCTNPNSEASIYLDFDAPIYQFSMTNYYNLRSAVILSIISILFTLFSTIFGFLTGLILLNIYLVFIAPIFACIALIFGICTLVIAGSVLNYTGVGFILFVVGILLESISLVLLSIVAGRLNSVEAKNHTNDNEPMFIERDDTSPDIQHEYTNRI